MTEETGNMEFVGRLEKLQLKASGEDTVEAKLQVTLEMDRECCVMDGLNSMLGLKMFISFSDRPRGIRLTREDQ